MEQAGSDNRQHWNSSAGDIRISILGIFRIQNLCEEKRGKKKWYPQKIPQQERGRSNSLGGYYLRGLQTI